MNKFSKRDMILNSIIEAYLRGGSPIGSNELGAQMDVAIPASTIRVYFKKLSDEGEITQLHISGGRIPTVSAMRRYWSEIFANGVGSVSITDERALKILCDKFELYCMVFGDCEQNLEEILNLNDRFLVLNFSADELVLKYDARVEKFLQNLLGISLDRLSLVCAQVGLSELRSKIKELKRTRIYFQENEILAFRMFEDERYKMILQPDFAVHMSEPLTFAPIFEDGFMGLKFKADFEGRNAVMICAGSVFSDYLNFINQIKEAA